MNRCENCGAPIGTLETPYQYRKHVVCRTCWERLTPHPESLTPADIVSDPIEELAAAAQSAASARRRQSRHVPATDGLQTAGNVLWGALALTMLCCCFLWLTWQTDSSAPDPFAPQGRQEVSEGMIEAIAMQTVTNYLKTDQR